MSEQHLYLFFYTINQFPSHSNLYQNTPNFETCCSGLLKTDLYSVPYKMIWIAFLQSKCHPLKRTFPSLSHIRYDSPALKMLHFLLAQKKLKYLYWQKLFDQLRHRKALKCLLERIDKIFLNSVGLRHKHTLKKTMLQTSSVLMIISLKKQLYRYYSKELTIKNTSTTRTQSLSISPLPSFRPLLYSATLSRKNKMQINTCFPKSCQKSQSIAPTAVTGTREVSRVLSSTSP